MTSLETLLELDRAYGRIRKLEAALRAAREFYEFEPEWNDGDVGWNDASTDEYVRLKKELLDGFALLDATEGETP